MNLRATLAERVPATFHWLQARGLYPKADARGDVRRLGKAPHGAAYVEKISGVHQGEALARPAFLIDGPRTVEYLGYFRDYSDLSPVTYGLFEVPDVRVWSEFGVHHSPAGNFIETYCSPRALDNPKYELTSRALRWMPIRHRHHEAIFLALAWNHNYYHWMIDILPRVRLALPYLEAGIPVAVPPSLRASSREALALSLRYLGQAENILDLAPGVHRFERLIMPTNQTHSMDVLPESRDFLRASVGARRTGGGKRIYVSRRDAAVRIIANEAQLLPDLERRGFESVTLSGLSIVEQAELFAGAEAIVAHHGAGLTNLAFCAPGTKVIEVFQQGHFAPCFARLAQLGGLPYGFLVGRAVGSNSEVDPAEFSALLDQAGL